MTDTTYITPEFVQGIIDEPGILGPAIVELATKYLALLGEFEVVSKSEWKLAGDLTELQMNYNTLKTKLANPVLLPAGYSARAGHPFHEGERNVMIPNKNGDWLSRFEVEHAIHVAGFPFTVKGE